MLVLAPNYLLMNLIIVSIIWGVTEMPSGEKCHRAPLHPLSLPPRDGGHRLGLVGCLGHLGQALPECCSGPWVDPMQRTIDPVQPDPCNPKHGAIGRFLFPEIDFELNPYKSVPTSKIHRKLSRNRKTTKQNSFESF
jgi:hypothetical protein